MSVTATYTTRDGWHVFECAEVPGCYVASSDARKTYDDVPAVIMGLMRLNDKKLVLIVPVLTFAEWQASGKDTADFSVQPL